MPTYVYRCRGCGFEKELRRSMHSKIPQTIKYLHCLVGTPDDCEFTILHKVFATPAIHMKREWGDANYR